MEMYESLGVLGEGTYGVVVKARHKETHQLVAIKKFKENEDDDEQVRKTSLREIRMLKNLRHFNIVNLLEVFRRKQKLYLVFEFIDRTILEMIEKKPYGLDESEVKRYTYQLLRATDYCHRNNVIHRDVKPENILISKNGVLKLCDFGFARTLGSVGAKYTDYVATRWYRSPELLVGDVEYSRPVDVWAIGCIFAEISTGVPLYPGESDVDQLHHIIRCFGRLTSRQENIFRKNPFYKGVELPVVPRMLEPLEVRYGGANHTKVWLQFLKSCLRLDPEARSSCQELMEHPYFADKGFRQELEEELARLEQQERNIETWNQTSSQPSSSSANPISKIAIPSEVTPINVVHDSQLEKKSTRQSPSIPLVPGLRLDTTSPVPKTLPFSLNVMKSHMLGKSTHNFLLSEPHDSEKTNESAAHKQSNFSMLSNANSKKPQTFQATIGNHTSHNVSAVMSSEGFPAINNSAHLSMSSKASPATINQQLEHKISYKKKMTPGGHHLQFLAQNSGLSSIANSGSQPYSFAGTIHSVIGSKFVPSVTTQSSLRTSDASNHVYFTKGGRGQRDR